MRTTIFTVLMTLAATFALNTAPAQAQMMPNWSGAMNQMIQQNMAFDAFMHQQAQAAAMQFLQDRIQYRMRTGDWGYLPGPVSPGELSRSISELNGAYDDYNRSWMQNSERQSDAVERWTNGAIRGNWYYQSPDGGAVHNLPYDHNVYNQENGYLYPGYAPGGENLYPVYPW